MTKVLIVQENIPESTDCFIVEANDNELELLKLCHGHYINGGSPEVNDTAMQPINLYLYTGDPSDCEEWAKEFKVDIKEVGKWAKNKEDCQEMLSSKLFDFVCVTGWIL